MKPLKPKAVRYIKLGRGGKWEKVSLERGELHFGHRLIPHELALTGDRDAIRASRIAANVGPGAASDDAREVVDFYTLGADCLWVTVARDHLWWTFADPEVIWLGGDNAENGCRIRKSLGGWCNTDIKGTPLRASSLSTNLTRTASYRRTICAVEAADYLVRRINGIEEPLVADANKAREALLQVTTTAIAQLHWADFETLVDIVFARSGWHRISALGGTQKTIDLAFEQAITGERAAVQVKSRANQQTLNGFIGTIDEIGTYDRLFFVCHTPKGTLGAKDREDVHVWIGEAFAATVIRVGLHDWVIEKIA